jgi:flavodoxin
MKKLVVYYSFEGNTAFIAKGIADSVGADLLELKLKSDPGHKGFMKYVWGGGQVMKREKPELYAIEKNPCDYDVIFIGTPVWAFTYAPALATFFSITKLKGKKIALFCCSGGGKGKTLEKMKAALEGNDFIGETDFIEPLKRNADQALEKAKQWAKGLN